jgi:hypothetical protein
MLTFESEANEDSKSQMKGVLGWFVGLVVPVQETFILGCSGQPNIKYFFLTVHYFNSCVPPAQQPAQAVVQGRLSLDVWSPAARVPLKRGRDQRKARHQRENHKLSLRGSEYGSVDGSGGRGGMFARNSRVSLSVGGGGREVGGMGSGIY